MDEKFRDCARKWTVVKLCILPINGGVAMNLSIAICDDEASICDLYKEKVAEFMQGQGVVAKITTFHDSVAFLNILHEESFALILLDIDMPGVTGLQIAEKMSTLPQKPLLVFVTNQDALVYETFQYHPFSFIRKSFLETELEKVLAQVLSELGNGQQRFVFKNGKDTVAVLLSDILYFEAEGNYIVVHTKQAVYRMRDTMTRLEHELDKKGFVRIHKGFLVNQEAVYKLGNEEVVLADGGILPIGRSNREQSREKLMRYLFS